MIKIEKGKKGICTCCPEPAVKKINDMPFCAHCGDKILMAVILKSVKALDEVEVRYQIQPKLDKKTTAKGR